MIYKSLAKRAGRRRARMEREVEPVPLSGPGVESGHSQAAHSSASVDLKFLNRASVVVGVVSVVVSASVGAVVVEGVVSVVVSASVGALPVVVVSDPVVVVSPPVVVASGVVLADVVASGVVPQQTGSSSSEQVGIWVVAASVDVPVAAALIEATQAVAKRTTATFIFSLRTFFLSVLSLSLCMQRLWVLSVSCLLLGAAYQRG